MKLHYSDGIGFAIPIDIADQIIRQLRKYGKVSKPYIGLSFGTVAVEDRVCMGRDAQNSRHIIII